MSNVPLPQRRSVPLLLMVATYLVFTVCLIAATDDPDQARPLEEGKTCLLQQSSTS